MADRSIVYSQQQIISFDMLHFMRDMLKAQGRVATALFGKKIDILSGFSAAQKSVPNLSIDLEAGEIFQWEQIDKAIYGALPADTNYTYQMGWADAQTVAFTTSALSAGQSQWALVQAKFDQVDEVREGDPGGGVRAFYNSANPTQPLQGVNNSGNILDTVRRGKAAVSVTYGNPATTGAEVPPNPATGNVPLYLINLTFGQTAITNGQIEVAGPSVYAGYPEAPFCGGLLGQHHKGNAAGQAPKIDVTQEIQGIVPLANLPASNTVGLLPTMRMGTGAPNGVLAGNQDDLYYDTNANTLWICTTTGSSSTAVWNSPYSEPTTIIDSFPYTVTVQYGVFLVNLSSANGVINLPSAALPGKLRFKRIDTTIYKAILTPSGGQQVEGQSTYDMNIPLGSTLIQAETTQSKWWVL